MGQRKKSFLEESVHHRYNPLSGEWVKVSPHRTKRPWDGRREEVRRDPLPAYDENCYLCPGNKRAGGRENPDYKDVFLFDNDFAALLPEVSGETEGFGAGAEADLFRAEPVRGLCKVICFSPRHDLTLAEMPREGVLKVVRAWTEAYRSLGDEPFIRHVQIFENRGEVMGCSNPHPHGQIWAEEKVPVIAEQERLRQTEYFQKHRSRLLSDYLRFEEEKRERLVLETASFVCLVPFWAVWPYEVMILPREKRTSLCELTEGEQKDLAEIIQRLGRRYDNLFSCRFPYSMGIHQSPTDGKRHEGLQMHLHYYPPLLRSATVKKFMVGYEMLGMPQRDITPETAAEALRGLSEELLFS